MPLSSELAERVRGKIQALTSDSVPNDESALVAPLVALQREWSHAPAADELLVETHHNRDGFHLFLFPFGGRLVHEGLGPLLASRIGREHRRSFSIYQTDYGIELVCDEPYPVDEGSLRKLLSRENLLEDILKCLNSGELARRQFRGIARVAGLVFDGYPGSRKTARQVQASSSLIFDVFSQFDPDNLLLQQARREVLETQLEFSRMEELLARIEQQRIVHVSPTRLTPFAFPLWAERIREQAGTEKFSERLDRMLASLEGDADATLAAVETGA